MKAFLSMDFNKREKIAEQIKEIFSKEPNIVFGYIFGSFLDAPSFGDIDVSVNLKEIKEGEVFDYEMSLSKKIAEKCGVSSSIVDVKILNFATNSFLNNVFSNGKLLFFRDENMLSEMIENTSLDALANEYISYQSLKELVPA